MPRLPTLSGREVVREVAKGTLRSLIRAADLSVAEFIVASQEI
jgi:hypothetical protein